ncbi:Vps51/Vps67-domain-containing protein [Cyathus striatus]|nr:Vps51/Vps67-domain-containing protein [Cyathus striatus]
MSSPSTPTSQRVSSAPRALSSPLRPAPESEGVSSPSNDIPSRQGSSSAPRLMGSATPPQKTRARDLLRKHYGLGVGPPPTSSNTADPMNLNSPAFDAKNYYEQLITTSSLPALLKRENELLTEIRQLDSERQSLVYNHHHELIAASDTIAAMKTRAESLDPDLDLLRAAFSEISRLAIEVSAERRPLGKETQNTT